MSEEIDHGRRRFLGTAAMTIAATRLDTLATVEANQRAPRELAAIGGAAEWLNSSRLTPSSLAGKVVLVDFCTYTCINWLRTLPYIRAWAQKYRPGLVVIGVHTPEFTFESDIDNVRRAVQQMRIDYPIGARNGKGSRCVSACRLTGSRRVLLTGSTWTTAATARWSNRGCIS